MTNNFSTPPWLRNGKNLTATEVMMREREAARTMEQWADMQAKSLETVIDANMIKVVEDEMAIASSLKAMQSAGFMQYGRRERLDGWIRSRKIEISYVAHAHEVTVTVRGPNVMFKEGAEHFPSEHMIAQIALGLEAT